MIWESQISLDEREHSTKLQLETVCNMQETKHFEQTVNNYASEDFGQFTYRFKGEHENACMEEEREYYDGENGEKKIPPFVQGLQYILDEYNIQDEKQYYMKNQSQIREDNSIISEARINIIPLRKEESPLINGNRKNRESVLEILIRFARLSFEIIRENCEFILFFCLLIIFLAASFAFPGNHNRLADSLFDWLAYYPDSRLFLFTGTLVYCGTLLLITSMQWISLIGGMKESEKKDIWYLFLTQNPIYQYMIMLLRESELVQNQFDLAIWVCLNFTFFVFRAIVLSLMVKLKVVAERIEMDSMIDQLTDSSSDQVQLRRIDILSKIVLIITIWVCVISAKVFYLAGATRVILLLFEGLLVIMECLKNYVLKLQTGEKSKSDSQSDSAGEDGDSENMIEPCFVLEIGFDALINGLKLLQGLYSIISHLIARFSLQNIHYSVLMLVTSGNLRIGLFGIHTDFVLFSKYIWIKCNLDRVFPKVVDDSVGGKKPVELCSICHEDLRKARKIASCGHSYHIICLFNWIQSQSKPQCPLCRAEIPEMSSRQYEYQFILQQLLHGIAQFCNPLARRICQLRQLSTRTDSQTIAEQQQFNSQMNLLEENGEMGNPDDQDNQMVLNSRNSDDPKKTTYKYFEAHREEGKDEERSRHRRKGEMEGEFDEFA